MAGKRTTKTETTMDENTKTTIDVTEEVVETVTEDVEDIIVENSVESVKIPEAIVEKVSIPSNEKVPSVLTNKEVAVYSVPTFDKKFKVGTMVKNHEYPIISIQTSAIYGKFYRIAPGFVHANPNDLIVRE